MPHATLADLKNKESHYINKFNSFREGYNQTPGGAMDQFKGRYEYGGGRLPVDKYQPTDKYNPLKQLLDEDITQHPKPKTRLESIKGIVTGLLLVIIFFTTFLSPIIFGYFGSEKIVSTIFIILTFITTIIIFLGIMEEMKSEEIDKGGIVVLIMAMIWNGFWCLLFFLFNYYYLLY